MKTALLIAFYLAIAFVIYAFSKTNASAATIDVTKDLPAILEEIRETHKLPALGAAIVKDGKLITVEAVGLRRLKGSEKVTREDKFHIGSITKSMTSTLAAFLVDEGKISWSTTIAEIFPEWTEEIHESYRSVTLEQLLSHTGGFPGNPPSALWLQAWKKEGTALEQRRKFVNGLLKGKPEAPPGTKNIYSNQGYAVAGHMMEKVMGKPWEELMRQYLFERIGMKSAGFGAPATVGQTDQPWGHAGLLGLSEVAPGPRADNPESIAPAGLVHCSLADLATYALFHIRGYQGKENRLKPETFKKLYTKVLDDYAMGWLILKRDWARDVAVFHNGSNTMFFAVLWMSPNRDFAVIAATNAGGNAAAKACDEVAVAAIEKYLPKK